MIVAVNDLSFKRMYQSKEEAVDGIRQWMYVCKKIESRETTAVNEIYSVMLNTSAEIAPGYPLVNIVKEFSVKEERSYFLHLLANLPKPDDLEEKAEDFCFMEMKSTICAYAKHGFLVSLDTTALLRECMIQGTIGEEDVSIRNISMMDHINLYSEELGIRFYEPNLKHGKTSYIDSKGRNVNPMDLSNEEAQNLLNVAIEIDGSLYGKLHGNYYCFRQHHNNYYHGYQNNDLDASIRCKIDERN